MQAMVLNRIGAALEWTELADRQPGPGEIRVEVGACGVCRTDLHVVDGELAQPQVPIIPGHEIVGRIDAEGAGVEGLQVVRDIPPVTRHDKSLKTEFEALIKALK